MFTLILSGFVKHILLCFTFRTHKNGDSLHTTMNISCVSKIYVSPDIQYMPSHLKAWEKRLKSVRESTIMIVKKL